MAGKLIITRGLPASGKSTWAAHFATRSENYDTTRVVTLDDIRTAIDARFQDGDEGVAQGVRDFTIRGYLEKGYTVISADTNLNPKAVERLIEKALRSNLPEPLVIEYVDFTHVSLEECLRRNAARWARGDCKVPDSAIVDMYNRFVKDSSS